MTRSRTQVSSDFIEDEFISAIERALGNSIWYPSTVEISRISQRQEGILGYDGVLTTMVPYYIQFKVPTYFTPKFSGKLYSDRKSLNIKDKKGFLAFKIRLDPKSKEFDQHNALHVLSLGSKRKAVYVCPKFYKRKQLTDLKKRKHNFPWQYGDIEILDIDKRFPAKSIVFNNFKIFSSSITIPIHKKITSKGKSHSFSFNDINETVFHSNPEQINEQPVVEFSEYLSGLVKEAITEPTFEQGGHEKVANNLIGQIPQLFKMKWRSSILREILYSELLFLGSDFNPKRSLERELMNLQMFEKLIFFEVILRKYFNIHQYFILRYNY